MKKILTAFFLILTTTTAFAIQEDKKIDLKGAIELALKTNPEIQLAKLDVEIAKNKIKEANKLQNPSLEFFQNIPKAGLGNPQTIGLDYTVEILKRGKRKATAKSNSLSVSDNQKFLEYVLIAEVKKSYINLLVKKSHLKLIKEQENLSRELYETMKEETKKGNLPETEAIQAKIVLNRAIMYSNIARSEVVSAQNYFNSVMNTSSINYDTKEDNLPDDYNLLMAISPNATPPSFEEIRNYAIANRFDLQMAKKEVETAKFALQEVKSQRIPDLALTGGYAYQTKGMSEDGRFQSGGYVGASLVNLPILYNYKPEIQNAEIETNKAELKYKDMETDAIRNVTDAWEKYLIARDNLNFYNKEILADSKELMVSSKKSLDKKEIDLTTFLVTKKLYLELILGYQDTLGEYYSSFADLLKEINADSLNFEAL
ncbi:MAG: TolC family protein [bacterium]|nr:TolC family protein [bacterium]